MDYILDYYKLGLFTDADMADFVAVAMITQAQYDSVKATPAA
ncbi:XkdX family protein [Lacticaseibacillus salsurivasis]